MHANRPAISMDRPKYLILQTFCLTIKQHLRLDPISRSDLNSLPGCGWSISLAIVDNSPTSSTLDSGSISIVARRPSWDSRCTILSTCRASPCFGRNQAILIDTMPNSQASAREILTRLLGSYFPKDRRSRHSIANPSWK